VKTNENDFAPHHTKFTYPIRINIPARNVLPPTKIDYTLKDK
jgi:hypothetical protein